MPYVIDFTSHKYRRRQLGAQVGSILLIMTLAGAAWVAGWVYRTWHEPTLAERLAEYQALAMEIEPLHAQWQQANTVIGEVAPWYNLLWGESVKEVLKTATDQIPRHPVGLRPLSWDLRTGGACRMIYELEFQGQDRTIQREQTVNYLSTMFERWKATVKAPGMDLGTLDRIELAVDLNLDKPKQALPPVPEAIQKAVDKIGKRRKSIQGMNIEVGKDGSTTVMDLMAQGAVDSRLSIMAVDPGYAFREGRRNLVKGELAVPQSMEDAEAAWRKFASRRWPWLRERQLDNPDLRREIESLRQIVNAGLPGTRPFRDWIERVENDLRPALLAGFDLEETFNDNVARDRLFESLPGLNQDQFRFFVAQSKTTNGLMLARWELNAGASGGSTGTAVTLDPLEVARTMAGIPDTKLGFVLDRLLVQFGWSARNGLELSKATASGLVAIVDKNANVKEAR